MQLMYADEYINCVQSGHKPDLALVGNLPVTDGILTESGKYILVIGGIPYEVKPSFTLYAQWDSHPIQSQARP